MNEPEITRPRRVRPRRLRRHKTLRNLVAETRVAPASLIVPHFVLPAERGREAIPSMPGVERLGRSDLLARVERDAGLGLRTVLLFGLTEEERKDASGSESRSPGAAVPAAVRELKRVFGDELAVITDVCLCAYTDHGHCGVLDRGTVDNDRSLAPLASMARVHGDAGADLVAPSDMMDGRVANIRDALDRHGLTDVGILSYAAKFASAFYGPFRDAAGSAPGEGDRRGYQLDPRNGREAVREALLDEEEGADILMVKPALAYLDVVHRVRQATRLPLAVYNVSGEYAAVKAAAERGWLDEPQVVRESLTAMRRAGADLIITYHARDAVEGGWLR
ncbi:MAG: porphobilinogen synthase [Acidobacteriota bacterium]|nr:porphobilinogen synthase [Acidobacteriota bacterium]